MREVTVTTNNGLPFAIHSENNHCTVELALLCGQIQDAQTHFSGTGERECGYVYKVRLRQNDGSVRTRKLYNVTDIDKWYIN